MEKLENDIARLIRLRFGENNPRLDRLSERLKKLGEEYGELVAAVINEDKKNLKEEVADVIISAIAVAQAFLEKNEINVEDIVDKKLDELFERIGEKR